MAIKNLLDDARSNPIAKSSFPSIIGAMNIENLTASQLRNAADLQEKIQKLQTELAGILGAEASAPAKTPGKRGPKKGGMSAEGRAKIAAAQKARWAKVNAEKGKSPKTEKLVKRKMSAAGRAAIAAGARARWAKQKGEAQLAVKAELKPAKRKMSAAGRAAIIAAQKARWAKIKTAKK